MFDTNRAGLADLYTDQSMLTFENEQFMGKQGIMTKLTVRAWHPASRVCSGCVHSLWHGWRPCVPCWQTLQFQTVQHKITTCDPQPSPSGGIFILVTGDLAVSCHERTRTQHMHPCTTPKARADT